MKDQDILDALAHYPRGAKITMTLELDDVRAALERRESHSGPEVVTTSWCASELGFSGRRWREWCEAGEIAGAVKDAAGRWRLPNQAARDHLAHVLRSGANGTEVPPAIAAPVTPKGPPVSGGRRRRGPWKKQALAGGRQ